MFNIIKSRRAFSLVELIVAVAITGILLLGTSVFFAQHLSQLNQLEDQQGESQSHLVFQEVLRKKLMQAQSAMNLTQDNSVILENKPGSQTPFTFVGLKEDKMILSDTFLFHDIELQKTAEDFPSVPSPTGIAYANNLYYVASFSENTIYECKSSGACNVFIEDVPNPVGITTDGSLLFITYSKLGEIWSIDLETKSSVEIATKFKQPTGIAYYQDSGGDEYLFVAESQTNVVKRINLQNQKSEIVVGLSDDSTCNSSALFCGLNFPTGLMFDPDEENLYIADTGNGRILKVSEPSILVDQTTDVVLEFEIDPAVFLEKFILSGNIGGETVFNAAQSNLPGTDANYDAGTTTFNNFIFETGYSIDLCQFSSSLFTKLPLDSLGFEVNDEIRIDGDLYTITAFKGSKNCESDPEADPNYQEETKLSIPPKEKEGQYGYGANYGTAPGTVVLALDDLHFDQSGFQTIEIETYDADIGLLEEINKVLTRVGDGSLGSEEDEVEVWIDGLTYPTGVSIEKGGEGELWITDAKDNTLTKFSLKTKAQNTQSSLKTLNVDDFIPFDLTSKFTTTNFTLSEPQDNLLEISFEVNLNENLSETYTLNEAVMVE